MHFTKALLSILVFALLSLSNGAPAQGWRIPNNDISRIIEELFTCPDDTPTTGTGVAGDIDCYNLSADDTVTTFTVKGGPRTLYVAVTDRDATEDALSLTVTGKNQFGGYASETFVFDGGDQAVAGQIAFAPYPVPVITINTVESDQDLISIYNHGFGLTSNPQTASDIQSEFVIERSASPITYTENATSTFFTKYGTTYSTYTNASLTASDEVRIRVITSARTPNQVGPGGNRYLGPNFTTTTTAE